MERPVGDFVRIYNLSKQLPQLKRLNHLPPKELPISCLLSQHHIFVAVYWEVVSTLVGPESN